ncbi:MAG: SDR family oxidoreductase, partial [Solirubrobacterales bacterium]
MRVFVAGASGAIGRPLIGQLIEAGHEVAGMTRREDRVAEIRGRGADCVVCDVFDPEALARAVAGARPEVVVHELTALPPDLDPRRKGIYEANNRIRREGTRNLVIAARAA